MINFYVVTPNNNLVFSVNKNVKFPKDTVAIHTKSKSGVDVLFNYKGEKVELPWYFFYENIDNTYSINRNKDNILNIIAKKHVLNFKELKNKVNEFKQENEGIYISNDIEYKVINVSFKLSKY